MINTRDIFSEDSVRLLPEIANLMYQITEFMLSRQRRTNQETLNVVPPDNKEEGQSESRNEEAEEVLHSDMVPDMLKKVLSMVAHLVRVKKELAERVRKGIYSFDVLERENLTLKVFLPFIASYIVNNDLT